ncbi:MAG: HlyD family type I secretion periplasmic adaptor subunit [Pseudomonadota bacterium]
MTNTLPVAQQKEWYASIPRSGRGPTLGGWIVLLLTFGGFGIWATTAPVAGAVIAAGTFVVTGQNKIIQHLEGGIIRDIKVKEGDIVEEGQTLITLDETPAMANLRRLKLRFVRLKVMAARLRAEAEHRDQMTFPTSLDAFADDSEVAAILQSQTFAFKTNRNKLRSEVLVLERGIKALEARIEGGRAQLAAVHEQQEIYSEELFAKDKLVKEGYVAKTEMMRLTRAKANLRGEIGRLRADIGDSLERIERARAQILQITHETAQSAVNELHGILAELDDVGEQIRAARDVLDRLNIKAPVRGIVVRLRYHTPGGVIESGKSVMEILPVLDDLIIEAQILPKDIDDVLSGQQATVRLPGLNQRTTPTLTGNVIYVSADALPNERRSAQQLSDIYLVRIKLPKQEIAKIEAFNPTPGMPAEVYIRTRERTFFSYLVEPIRDSMARAFREA